MGIFKKIFGKSSKTTKTLSEQYIRCPHCSTLYALFSNVNVENISDDVRCGTCHHTFSALTNRSEPKNKIHSLKYDPNQPRLIRAPAAVVEPVTNTIIEPATDHYVETETGTTIAESYIEPATETITESYVEPETETITESYVEPETETITESYVEPETETLTQTYIDPETTTVAETYIDPESEISTQPAADTYSEPTSETRGKQGSASIENKEFSIPTSNLSSSDSTAVLEIQDTPLTSMQILAMAPGDAIASAPIYTKTKKTKSRRSAWAYLLALTLFFLIISLVSLILWLNRETLAQYSVTRPWLESMCQLIDCTLSPYRDPSQLLVQQHQLTPDPANPSKLELHALIENSSPYAQPLGTLEIQINDLQGNPVKKLTFAPEEYAPEEAKSLLEPGQTLYIRLEFIQPTVDLFSYEIKFI